MLIFRYMLSIYYEDSNFMQLLVEMFAKTDKQFTNKDKSVEAHDI